MLVRDAHPEDARAVEQVRRGVAADGGSKVRDLGGPAVEVRYRRPAP